MSKNRWDLNSIPDQTGKVIIVTGGNVGLGFQSCVELAKRNADIIIACRSMDKGNEAIAKLKSLAGNEVNAEVIPLDLTDMESIKRFAETFHKKYKRLDVLLNNAGVVNLEHKAVTAEGLEMHMATNHLGHFALTGRLFEILINTPNSRVVTVSSGGYKGGVINYEDFNWETRKYNRIKAYGDSKLANLMFMKKLQEYFVNSGSTSISVSAHPGLSASERQQAIGIGGKLSKLLASPLTRGCRPQLMAATAKEVKGGEYYGPKYFLDGPPVLINPKSDYFTEKSMTDLWEYSEKITNVKYQ